MAVSLRNQLDEAQAAFDSLLTSYHDLKLQNEQKNVIANHGCQCEATKEEMARYFNYTAWGSCPDDWFFVEDLIFKKNCRFLPNRRCFSRTPRQVAEPQGLPDSLFGDSKNDLVRWDLHQCNSFECLNSRTIGDCLGCFNISLDLERWTERISRQLMVKTRSRRIGLDVGGGTGTFAAMMAKLNMTVVATAMNSEWLPGTGVPYLETIAMRGLISLHIPHNTRLPFFDNTLDLVHSCNTIKYFPYPKFEEQLLEWDHVLRPGGVIWMDLFYSPVSQMAQYIRILDSLNYTRLFWKVEFKQDLAEWRDVEHLYLHAMLEKPVRLD